MYESVKNRHANVLKELKDFHREEINRTREKLYVAFRTDSYLERIATLESKQRTATRFHILFGVFAIRRLRINALYQKYYTTLDSIEDGIATLRDDHYQDFEWQMSQHKKELNNSIR